MCNIDKFPTTIQMLNNELASYTWARLTWEQRVTLHHKIGVVANQTREDKTCYYMLPMKQFNIVAAATLCQMQF